MKHRKHHRKYTGGRAARGAVHLDTKPVTPQQGGNPAVLIPAALGLVDAAAKTFKPASRLKETRLGKVPVLGSILEGLSQMGYGESLFNGKPAGPFVTAIEADQSYMKKRRLPIYPNEGQRSAKVSSYPGSWGAGAGSVVLTNY